jgi:hypothetical protein
MIANSADKRSGQRLILTMLHPQNTGSDRLL